MNIKNKLDYPRLLSIIKHKKRDALFKVIDTHVHPLDVMGVLHQDDYRHIEFDELLVQKIVTSPTLLEKLKFGSFVNFFADIYCKYFEKNVNDEIIEKYAHVHQSRILYEMDCALVDRSVLVPVEPYSSIKKIAKEFSDTRFLYLGSIDIHGLTLDEVQSSLNQQVRDHNIVGLKLHPNLQNFQPIPEKNSDEISQKLDLIYRFCKNNNLYVLFHGGLSFFTKYIHTKYGQRQRSRNNAIIQNFFYDDQSTIFSKYDLTAIIAHLGHYGINKINESAMIALAKTTNNVFFDTSGVSPKLIGRVINLLGSERVIFGSDAIYNRQLYGVLFVASAIENSSKSSIQKDCDYHNVFHQNYVGRVLRQ